MTSKIIIKDSDITSITLLGYLEKNTDFFEVCKAVEARESKKWGPFVQKEISLDLINSIADYVIEQGNQIGWHAFTFGGQEIESDYQSISLTYNPNQLDAPSENVHQATLGSKQFKTGINEHYKKMSNKNFKNTYSDSFGFLELTPIAQSGALGRMISGIKRTIIRSRISRLICSKERVQHPDFCWHNDESIFVNFRINIPLRSTKNHVIQIIQTPGEVSSIVQFPLIPGFSYGYNTHLYHRPTCLSLDHSERINMILGITPWLDYNREKNQWESNEFYGKMHPFEMLLAGHILPTV
jgi:hypothetical protein